MSIYFLKSKEQEEYDSKPNTALKNKEYFKDYFHNISNAVIKNSL